MSQGAKEDYREIQKIVVFKIVFLVKELLETLKLHLCHKVVKHCLRNHQEDSKIRRKPISLPHLTNLSVRLLEIVEFKE
jgi:hypothetical protein